MSLSIQNLRRFSVSVKSEPKPSISFGSQAYFVAKAWLRDPTQVASIFPSSPFLTSCISDRNCVRNARCIVELGPGAGGTTTTLLSCMEQQSRLLTIEKTKSFMTALDQIADDRLINELGDALNLSRILTKYSMPSPDVIISGIPFSSIAPQVGSRIIAAIHRSLAPGGTFIAYQLRNHVHDLSRSLFGNPTVELIPLNIPPLRVFTWQKVSS